MSAPFNGNHHPNGDLTEFRMDRRLMLEVLQRGKRRFVVGFIVVTLLMLVVNLFFLPQSYSSTVSFSLMQSGAPTSGLAAMVGLGSAKQSYLGVLKSRRFAESVVEQEGIQAFYHLEDREDAIEMIKKAVKVEENIPDGLIVVTCTLKGPAKLARDPGGERKIAAQKAANIANEYERLLLAYLKNNDTERDSILLRQGESEVRRQRENYIGAVAGLQNFVRQRRRGITSAPNLSSSPGLTSPTGMSGEGGQLAAVTAATEIQQLYIRRGQFQEQIEGLKASRNATKNLIQNSPNGMTQMPDEDQLLNTARAQVNIARNRLNNLLISLSEENPRVLEAREALALAERNLKAKQEAVLSGQTSDSIKLKSLQASYDAVVKQIERAEKNFQFGREAMADYETQKNEVLLALEALKTVSSRYAEMRLSMVSAQNRMTMVDMALPARHGSPGFGMASILSVFAALGFVAVWIGFAYLSLGLRMDSGIVLEKSSLDASDSAP